MYQSDSQRKILILPGLGGSGSAHWQTRWEELYPQCQRVEQDNWNIPHPQDWIANLDKAVRACSTPPILVAHSLACALVAHWAQFHKSIPIEAALLVAPADINSEDHTPFEVRDFAPMPMRELHFPSTVVASSNDPYVDVKTAQLFATAWGSDFVNIGNFGHINAEAHMEDWLEGWKILNDMLAAQSLYSQAYPPIS